MANKPYDVHKEYVSLKDSSALDKEIQISIDRGIEIHTMIKTNLVLESML